jgi:26S proteasome regulatory subunit T4
MIREMFAYAKEHEPCIIFMDEIDAIGGRRFSEGTSADREIQRTLMEVSPFLSSLPYLGLLFFSRSHRGKKRIGRPGFSK